MIGREFLSSARLQPAWLYHRLRQSAVVWSWAFTGFRLAAGLILLPLILRKLPTPDLGMYYVLLSLSALVPLIDFGFGPTIGRFVSYAMGGAQDIQAQGVPKPGASTTANYRLMWELLLTMRRLYRYLTLALLVVLGVWGTYCVELRIADTSSISLTRLAWVATLLTACLDMYSSWWVVYLRSMDQVRHAAQIGLLAIGVRVLIAAVLLLLGWGLLSLPVGSLFGSLLQRGLAKHWCLRLLPREAAPGKVDFKRTFEVVWPNTWRLGLQYITSYLTINANMAICLHVLGLTANAQYGLSVQLLGIISGMAAVWINVKWPVIGQCYARHDLLTVQRILWPRVWLQNVTFLAGAAALVLAGPWLLQNFGSGKELLPIKWLLLLAVNGFLEGQFNTWGTLLSTENRLPYLWPAVATNVLSLALSLILIHTTDFGLGALVLGPLCAGLVFNHWYWPPFAARRLGTRLVRFLFTGPQKTSEVGLEPVPR